MNIPVRFYFALTNLCNRACELCSCHSDPSHGTHLARASIRKILANSTSYEAQLEGGEPTIHPEFSGIVADLLADPRCERVILCTNGVKLPAARSQGALDAALTVLRMERWLERFDSKPFLLKPSINSHLLERDPLHLEKMSVLARAFGAKRWEHEARLTFNVRRRPRPLSADGDAGLIAAIKAAGLYALCNDFEYQRYGKAENEESLERPFIVANPVPFHLISPDGRNFGTDLIARARHMEQLG